ncbi:MAG TPA: carboxypeptidase-like regulatory domain-containing protein, partial [Bryobacteraceae bacterium]|nr:carboxypeptidase-like regulatory domain-containing protein [Bryobacteraceae bacterium]
MLPKTQLACFEGQVTDPSTATVPSAKVVARNTATGFAATQDSSQAGNFHFSYLPVGEYDLHVSAAGFAD